MQLCNMQVCKYASMQVCDIMWKLGSHFLTKQSFAQFVDQASNPKTSFTKVVQLGILFKNIYRKVQLKLSFGHKAVILPLSELYIKSKTSFKKFAKFNMLFEIVG